MCLAGQFQMEACTASSSNVTITVNTAPSISNQPANQTTCAGTGAKTFTITAGGSSPTYQWQYSPDNSTWNNVVTGTPANITYTNSTTATLSVNAAAAAAAGTYYYRCVVSVAGCASPAISNAATFTVNINSTLALTSAAGTDAQTVCNFAPITTITYAWVVALRVLTKPDHFLLEYPDLIMQVYIRYQGHLPAQVPTIIL